MNIETLVSKLEQSGSRLSDLESKVALVRGKLRFWRNAALIAGGIAVVLFVAYHNARKRLEQCEQRNQIAV